MDTRYHIYFAGELIEGHAEADVQARIAKLFNANDATLARLFSGQVQMIKRDCDRATAAKYKAAIEKAGGKPIIKVAEQEQPAPEPEPVDAPTASPEPTQPTAAEKIAALAAAADVGTTARPAPRNESATSEASDTPGDAEKVSAAPPSSGGIDLAEPGSDVLREDERQTVVSAEIDTSGLILDEHTDRLAPEAAPAPAAPDTSHLNVGEVGETIPTLPRHQTLLDPDTDNIGLAPEGGDLSDCAPPPAAAPDLDLSGLNLAPTGAAVLEEKYRKQETATAPSTDHLTLDD